MNDYQVFLRYLIPLVAGKNTEVESTELKNSDFMHDTWKEIFFFLMNFQCNL